MTPFSERTQYTNIWQPYGFDRIEVSCPAPFSLIGEFWGEFESGPNLALLADYAGKIAGPGYYGIRSLRKLGFWSEIRGA